MPCATRVRRAPLACLVLASLAVPGAGQAGALRWASASERSAGEEGATAVASDPAQDALAFGDSQGAWLRRGDELFRRVALTERVNDLLFDARGSLWIATDGGLFEVDAQGRLHRRSLAAGERARRVVRLAAAGGTLVAATDLGAYASSDGVRFRAIDAEVPEGPVSAAALSRDGRTLWLSVGRRLWRAELAGRDGVLGVAGVRPEPLAAPRVGESPLDLATGLPGVELAALFPRAIALRREAGGAFELHRPALPPGALARRLVHARGRYWLATDRGLLEAASLEGPWERAGFPAGAAASAALAELGGRLFAATASGLLVGATEEPLAAGARPPVSPAPPPAPAPPPSEPGIREVQRAALAYLELDGGEVRRMRRGLAVRGLLPEVDVHAGLDRSRFRGTAYDQTFVSGAVRHLYDSDEDRERELGYGVLLRWDLGSLAFDPELVDVSREAREVIELRDDVLDEVNQLYYERRRVLVDLGALAPEAPEAERLRLRAAELGAGLDAWTGGWFGRHALSATP